MKRAKRGQKEGKGKQKREEKRKEKREKRKKSGERNGIEEKGRRAKRERGKERKKDRKKEKGNRKRTKWKKHKFSSTTRPLPFFPGTKKDRPGSYAPSCLKHIHHLKCQSDVFVDIAADPCPVGAGKAEPYQLMGKFAVLFDHVAVRVTKSNFGQRAGTDRVHRFF